MSDVLPHAGQARGIVDDRHLVAVQTFDIARLTTHAVPVVPQAFVAVSGMGPREDSNGSGKTSFLIAVSLLLADPQWRFESNGGRFASGILFKPDAAGVDRAQMIPAAPHGYVVGVFAHPGNPPATALTVWVRISTTAPYVEANWVSGIRVADAPTDAERSGQADALWREMGPARVLSARRMAEELYGGAPRCLTYLDTALRPAVPSLLSQQLTEMEPEAIGSSLIALSGMADLLEQEAALRGQALERKDQMEQTHRDHEKAAALDEVTMAGVRARAAARISLEAGQREWDRYLAASYLRVHEHDHALGVRLGELRASVTEADTAVGEAHKALAALRAATGLAEAANTARGQWSDAKETLRQAENEQTQLATRRGVIRSQRAELLPQIDGWRGTAAAQAHAELDAARGGLFTTEQKALAANEALEKSRQHLADVEQGRSGRAGEAIVLLEAAGINAVGLLDQLSLTQEARAQWEPRLSPWRDAVIVGAGQAERARSELRSMPGALIIEADREDTVTVAVEGVSSTVPVSGFLRTLQQRLVAVQAPDGARDDDLALTVVGGFTAPITGRATRVRLAHEDVERCGRAVEIAAAAVRTAKAVLKLAQAEDRAATAAEQLDQLKAQDDTLAAQQPAVEQSVTDAQNLEAKRQRAWEQAQNLAAAHTEKVRTAELRWQAAAKTRRDATKEVETAQRRRTELGLAAWQALWDRSLLEAADLMTSSPAGGTLSRPALLHRAAQDHLRAAYEHYGLRDQTLADAPEDLRRGEELRRVLLAEDPAAVPRVGFGDVAAPLQIRLAGHAEADQLATSRVEAERKVREEAMAALVEGADTSSRNLHVLQDMIEQHLDGLFAQISKAFHDLDIQRNSPGARLEHRSIRPDGPRPWRWEVTPCWKRSANSAYISYRENANSAQVKVYAVQLVLAALLADAETQGRVLILDELGNSLGENNRKDMLASLREVARRQRITILGTCQDSVLTDAAEVCDELLWFTHACATDAYNQPTRAWGYDPHAERVELTADWITAGRPDD